MKICIATMYYPPDRNGVATYSASLTTGSIKKGVEVSVITRKRPRRIKNDIEIFQIDVPSIDLESWRNEKILADGRRYCLKFAKGLYDFFKEREFDVINLVASWDDYLMVFACRRAIEERKNKSKLVLTVGGGGKQPPKEMNSLRSKILNMVDAIAVMGLPIEKELLRIGVRRNLIRYVPPGVDLKLFKPFSKPQRQDIVVLYVGRIDRIKGLLDIIEVAEKLQNENFIFRIVGDASTPEERRIVKYHLMRSGARNILLEKGVDNEQVAGLLSGADIFIYPSYEEWFGISVLEAIACGLPCVVSREGGLPEMVVNGKNGFVIKPGDVEGIKHALLLLKDPKLRARFGENSRRISEKYSDEKLSTTYLRIYEKI
jgi:glycosyltransferase involved in cell wall biosynthesis